MKKNILFAALLLLTTVSNGYGAEVEGGKVEEAVSQDNDFVRSEQVPLKEVDVKKAVENYEQNVDKLIALLNDDGAKEQTIYLLLTKIEGKVKVRDESLAKPSLSVLWLLVINKANNEHRYLFEDEVAYLRSIVGRGDE